MSLSERLKTKQCKKESVLVDGDKYIVTGKTKLERGRLFAKARKKDGSTDTAKLESVLLEACVCGDDGTSATANEWENVPSHITGPLVSKIMEVCGMDRSDLGDESDPKDSSTTES